ncbi:transcriptional regulator [Candidatus Methylomirabilis lanthanidiphila]|uniref:Transcriptional regulator n=1 Tax=Candidatus Methylomirabilis lanthanidiphila TaxID=2211376 RepID=A0A564ZL15_9BACT|nr:DUF4160 domain-containing protein [Candidatus Methylomirabilis lanthanidiphila]VUZ85248.1 transcriptional regulator [Candidatus Methylomirabilis lanthanidiphila]
MPIVSSFFGIVIRMYYDEHNPPHLHAEYQGRKALLDFRGNITKGDLQSRTALRLVRDWIELHVDELYENWELARAGKDIKQIAPLA